MGLLRSFRRGDAPFLMLLVASGLAGLVLGVSDRQKPQKDRPLRDGEKRHASPDQAITEAGRGRRASSPATIPARGWTDVLWRTYRQIQADRVFAIAAGITYYSVLALFPAIAAAVAIYGLFADPATMQSHVEQAKAILPYGAADIVGAQLKTLAAKGSGTLGVTFMVGLGVSLWSANSGMKAMFDALNVAYGEEERRSFVTLNGISLVFTLAGIVLAFVILAAMLVVPAVLAFLPLGPLASIALQFGRWIVLLAFLIIALAALYRWGPSREEPRWRWVTVGSVAAAVLWIAASWGLSVYAANFADYDKTYGSLGAVVGLMVWMWVSAIVILAGAELNAEIEHQTLRDTTTGSAKPLGARGAAMADTVGASAD